MPYANEYQSLKHLYGDGLDAQSHGESYFKLFQSRFRPGGLYLMDEPEAPLSPNRQLTLIAMLKQMIEQDAQFIIATHSPILLAYPKSTIYNFEHGKIERAEYDELEHVQIMRGFLNNPDAYLKHLME
jgi:predicted ATPase